ncbi:MAG: diaminopimelate epimerase [Planctomycetes bacterium RBG_16_64_10]|nr:MAG: diaminopimelate epimerase [Planctomycetes bacterium RBG_16_64_10]
MRFTKMHGAGNDYIYVDCFHVPMPKAPDQLARRMADRHLGVGGDGLILICPSAIADARMRMFNADGSEAEMCGNGIRCVAKYLYEHGLCPQPTMTIETGAGVLRLDLQVGAGRVDRVRVDMGLPRLAAAEIPTTLSGDPVVDVPLTVDGKTLAVTCVSMGNPHCVTYVDELTDGCVLGWGPKMERDRHFPQRTNVEFVQVLSRAEVRQRTWERGAGETLACGTGACAVCVAGVLSGRTDRRVTVHLQGGDLVLEWQADNHHVYMTGPAVEVFQGEW